MNSVRNSGRDFFWGGISIMDIKRQEIVVFFFKISCFKGENEKCF